MAKLAGTGQSAAILAPAALVVLTVVVLRPEFLLLAIFASTILLELGKSGPGQFESLGSFYYHKVGKGLTVMNVFFVILVLAMVVAVYRRRGRFLLAGPLTVALLLLTAATITGQPYRPLRRDREQRHL